MLSSDFIINKYPTYKVFNIWDKYKYIPIDFVFDNDWTEICDKDRIITLINEIFNILYYEGQSYKLANGIYIDINGNKLNIVIMKQVSGPDTIGYKINEYDCKYLDIKYQPNLEVFNSEGIKWIKCQGNKKLYN